MLFWGCLSTFLSFLQLPSTVPLLAVYDLPPTVTPAEQLSPCEGVGPDPGMAAGEQDVLPDWGLRHVSLLVLNDVFVTNNQVHEDYALVPHQAISLSD